MKPNIASRITNYFVNYFTLSHQLVPQAEAEASIREDVSFRGTNTLILVLAILIASLGLNTNSTAVIIGAMLISPLMGPIIGIGLGVGIHDFDLIKLSVRNLLIAAAFSVVTSTLYFLISPVSEGHSELLARTSPTIYDVLIGFFGGGAGIVAICSRSKGNVIPGVAIATALMPPLCTAGYGLATWQLSYFFGAFYLFLINSIYIAFATFIGVKLLGYKGLSIVDDRRSRRVRTIVYTLALLTMLPSIWLTINMMRDAKFRSRAQQFISEECRFPETQVVSDDISQSGGQKVITLTLLGKVLPADSLERALMARLPYYHLRGTQIRIVQGSFSTTNPEAESQEQFNDVYRVAQSTILAQQSKIDSLHQELNRFHRTASSGLLVAPEIKILFPEVEEIAVARTIFASVDEAGSDTANIALVHFQRPMTAPQQLKFREYLGARLSMSDIQIISAPKEPIKPQPNATENSKNRSIKQ